MKKYIFPLLFIAQLLLPATSLAKQDDVSDIIAKHKTQKRNKKVAKEETTEAKKKKRKKVKAGAKLQFS